MALVACYECGKQISTEAAACPQCGAPRRAGNNLIPEETPAKETERREVFVPAAVEDELRPSFPAFLSWVGFIILLGNLLFSKPNAIMELMSLVCGAFAFRFWLRRRTLFVILKRQSIDGFFPGIYFAALWSYLWRNGLVFGLVVTACAFTRESPEDAGRAVGTVGALWIVASVLILDVPFWVRRKVRKILNQAGQSLENSVRPEPSPVANKAATWAVLAVISLILAGLTLNSILSPPTMNQRPASPNSTAAAEQSLTPARQAGSSRVGRDWTDLGPAPGVVASSTPAAPVGNPATYLGDVSEFSVPQGTALKASAPPTTSTTPQAVPQAQNPNTAAKQNLVDVTELLGGSPATLKAGAPDSSPAPASQTLPSNVEVLGKVPVFTDDQNSFFSNVSLATSGDLPALFQVARAYETGRGVNTNNAQAFKVFKMCAERGVMEAQYNVAQFYYRGKGTEKDDVQAAFWFAKAADQGSPDAAYILGTMYEDGIMGQPDFREAAKWYLKAAKQGDSDGQAKVGYLYSQGLGFKQDNKEALKWSKSAAEQGNAAAQANLACLYGTGTGVDQDLTEAFKWTIISAGNGYQKSIKLLEVFKTTGDPPILKEAQRRAANFMPKKSRPSNTTPNYTPPGTN